MQATEHFARKSRPADFEDRDLTILAGLAEGLTNKEICDSAQLPSQVVKSRLRTILKNLGLNNRTQAALWAAQHGVGRSLAA